ncbi:hypothetical protein T439DRAFT_335284 [Meredithblackwellia eburnea MCA 4105]
MPIKDLISISHQNLEPKPTGEGASCYGSCYSFFFFLINFNFYYFSFLDHRFRHLAPTKTGAGTTQLHLLPLAHTCFTFFAITALLSSFKVMVKGKKVAKSIRKAASQMLRRPSPLVSLETPPLPTRSDPRTIAITPATSKKYSSKSTLSKPSFLNFRRSRSAGPGQAASLEELTMTTPCVKTPPCQCRAMETSEPLHPIFYRRTQLSPGAMEGFCPPEEFVAACGPPSPSFPFPRMPETIPIHRVIHKSNPNPRRCDSPTLPKRPLPATQLPSDVLRSFGARLEEPELPTQSSHPPSHEYPRFASFSTVSVSSKKFRKLRPPRTFPTFETPSPEINLDHLRPIDLRDSTASPTSENGTIASTGIEFVVAQGWSVVTPDDISRSEQEREGKGVLSSVIPETVAVLGRDERPAHPHRHSGDTSTSSAGSSSGASSASPATPVETSLIAGLDELHVREAFVRSGVKKKTEAQWVEEAERWIEGMLEQQARVIKALEGSEGV